MNLASKNSPNQPKTVLKKLVKLGQHTVKPMVKGLTVNVGQPAQKSSKFVPKNATCPNKNSPKKNVVKQGQICLVNAGQTCCNLVNTGKQKTQSTLRTCGGEEGCPEICTTQSDEERERYV